MMEEEDKYIQEDEIMNKNTVKLAISIVAWVVTFFTVIAALCITEDSNCLWAFAFPMIMSIYIYTQGD
jgi:hypothetical protein